MPILFIISKLSTFVLLNTCFQYFQIFDCLTLCFFIILQQCNMSVDHEKYVFLFDLCQLAFIVSITYSFIINSFSQSCIVHCWRMVRIKVICKSKAWCPAHTHKIQQWVEAIRLAFIQSYRTFIIRNRCHLHRFCIQHIIHTHKHIMDTICCPFHRPMNFTRISIR